jgi:type II secretory pathway pseudopilin PulG
MRNLNIHSKDFQGFSLVEVVLALGIVAFAVTVIFALLGTLTSSDQENRERKELIAAVDGLHQYLQKDVPFDTAFLWAKENTRPELIYVTYRARRDTAAPDPGSVSVRSVCFESGSPPYPIENLEAAREGRWVKARLVFSPDLTPDGTALPANADDFDSASLVFNAQMAAVAEPTLAVPDRTTFETTISINR